ncbi:MAG: hypothetical protein U0V72_02675 [Cytophagales bacterium]
MREKFNINGITIIIDATKIEYDSKKAHIHAVKEDDEFTFEAISCAARPVEFSIVNQLYKLDKELVKKTCDECNQNKTLGVLSTNNYYLILSPFVDRFTFFGEEQAEALTNGVIEICKDKNISSLRITQFCMLRSDVMPAYLQFKGIIKALTERKDSTLKRVFFDIPEDHFYDLKILFKTFE